MSRKDELDAAFYAFHKANPHVYRRLVQMTYQAQQVGRRRIGVKMMFEVLRWEHTISTSAHDFKLNNNLASRYARFIMRHHPDLDGMFALRGLNR